MGQLPIGPASKVSSWFIVAFCSFFTDGVILRNSFVSVQDLASGTFISYSKDFDMVSRLLL